MTDQTKKNYLKKTFISDISNLKKKIFDDFNFLHHQNFNQQFYIDLNVLKQHKFDVMIYYIQNDYNNLLNHTMKKNQQKMQLILFLSKLLINAEI